MNCSGTIKLTAALILLALMTLLPSSDSHTSESTNSGDFESTRILAEQGDASAQFELGEAYYHGDGVGQELL